MSRYVPTTDAVKTNYASSMYAHNKGQEIDPHRFFDSWLIAHDAEMQEKWEEERRTFKELEGSESPCEMRAKIKKECGLS